jgi:hypothetical protein
MSASGTPVLGSRRSSYIEDGERGDRAVPVTALTHPTNAAGQTTSLTNLSASPVLEFAKMRNPTIALRIGPHLSVELTYAALLQYSSILLCVPRASRLLRFPTIASGIETNAESGPLPALSAAILLLAVGTIEPRQKSERLGLRRTSLLLCTVLFCLALVLAVWPTSAQGAYLHPSSTAPVKDSSAFNGQLGGLKDRQQTLAGQIHSLYESDVDVMCKSSVRRSATVLQLDTPDGNIIRIHCT